MKLKHPFDINRHREIGASIDAAEDALQVARMWITDLPPNHPARRRMHDLPLLLETLRRRMNTQLKDDGHIAEWVAGEIYGPGGL